MVDAPCQRVICIMGPTATGKSSFALQLAERSPCEIISVDSAMVYRDMDIGTAKPDKKTRSDVPHYLIDILDPLQRFSAAEFCARTNVLLADIQSRGKTPLLVGGTMLYFNALQNGMSDLPSSDASIRQELQLSLEESGLAALYKQLQNVDRVSADTINRNDPQRIIRALEVYLITGKPMSDHFEHSPKIKSPYQFENYAFMPDDRIALHKVIKARFEQMLRSGFVEEVEQLFKREDLHAELPSMRSVGYRQVWDYLSGNITYDEMSEKAVIATRQLAKRQMTWLRRWSPIKLMGDVESDVNTIGL